ncbi:MAG: hypothetical protein ACE5FP_05040 [Gemmatimonadota bacterium]
MSSPICVASQWRAPAVIRLSLSILLVVGAGRPLLASVQDASWNDTRSRQLVRSAIDARKAGRDNDLERFSAYAEGQVHYLAEYGDDAADQAVRSDRIALELHWRRGVGSRQTIVGRRDMSWIPTDIEYHIDHLSLVVDNFGDRIRIGDGDEVRDVLSPVAPGAPDTYEYRLTDSLSMRIGGRLTELYRVEVRPVSGDSAGVVGTLDIERKSFAVARMAVTFTPVSYVDPTVRSVSVDLQNALVSNRVWLPAVQHVEVRRQIRFLDLPFGGTIRASYRVLSWDLDPTDEVWIPLGHSVDAVDDAELKRYMGWRTEEADGAPELLRADSALFERIRSEATRVVRGRYLGGTSRLRLQAPATSSLLRVRRAEGLYVGIGARYDLDGHWHAAAGSGYAFGPGTYEGSVLLGARFGELRAGLEAFVDRPADIGPWSAASGLVATGGALFRGDDFLDPFFESGVHAWVRTPVGGGTGEISFSTARHDAATLELNSLSDTPRSLTPVLEGRDARVTVSWNRHLAPIAGSKIRADLTADLAATGDFTYTRWVAEFRAVPTEPDARWGWEGHGGFGLVTGDIPPQRILLIGGRGTLPGYGFRVFAGETAAFAQVSLARTMAFPWLRLRALGAIGWTMLDEDDTEFVQLGFADSDGPEAAVGGGVSIVYDLIRIDVARGLGEQGVWEWILSVNPQFRAPL